ncbi:MAG: NADH-quinone oxidoreductase subunit C [Clostridia bacterium]|nr:NADH-quinone oxidoreductase subunit C [Clostridia bacterium]
MIENLVDISKDQLLGEVQNMLFDDYRFVTATSVDNGDGTLDIIYHFDKDLVMKHFKIKVRKDEEVPSISKIYFCAILVENEIKELFGANITNIAIDYGGHMLLSDDELDSPMGRQQIIIEERKGDK